jgi:hypothetical protein
MKILTKINSRKSLSIWRCTYDELFLYLIIATW